MSPEILPVEIARDLTDPKAFADMERIHRTYSWIRANNPLGRAVIDGYDPFWVVSKHSDVSHISINNELFHNADRSIVISDRMTIEQLSALTGSPHFTRTLVHLDDPDHRKLRALTQLWFMPNSLGKLEARIRALAKTEVERMAGLNGECDFVTQVAVGYPLRVIMEILGVPPEDEPRMLMLTQEIFSPDDPELGRSKQAEMTPAERANTFNAITADFHQYFKGITDDRRRNPRNDVATVLANATLDGKPLSDDYRTGYYMIIATAGHDTTSSSTATALWALCRYPELLPRLKADPALIPGFVDETIRWGTPVRHFMRTATAETELRGRRIAKGDWLMLCYGSANRDEEVFEDPFAFRIDRKPNRHIAFGYGGHVCLGQHLAKLEIRVLLQELLPRLESVELAGEMKLAMSTFVGGPKHLPIRFKLSC